MRDLKKYNTLGLAIIVVTCIFCNAGENKRSSGTVPQSDQTNRYKLVEAFPALTFDQPVELTSPDDKTDRIFLVAQKGTIHVFGNTPDTKTATVFIDITGRIVSGGERGLLGLAFHPDYKSNGYFYVNYTRGDPLETVISRFKVSSSNPNIADPQSELVLLRFTQPYANHNGGKVAFGNDGYLYIAAGDGGSYGDPGDRAQNRKELLGKILRIDVNKPSGNLNYSIPADNPYVKNTDGFREEIYAYGMRNPWRFNFDRKAGTLWAGDVGQNKTEEVDIIEKGGNYGWRIMEAEECYKSRNCDKTGLILPIWSYEQGGETGRSITGGFVCHDKNLPALEGQYIFGDYASGNVWALTYSDKQAVSNARIAQVTSGLSSFGEDSKSNLYLLAYGSGKVFKLIAVK